MGPATFPAPTSGHTWARGVAARHTSPSWPALPPTAYCPLLQLNREHCPPCQPVRYHPLRVSHVMGEYDLLLGSFGQKHWPTFNLRDTRSVRTPAFPRAPLARAHRRAVGRHTVPRARRTTWVCSSARKPQTDEPPPCLCCGGTSRESLPDAFGVAAKDKNADGHTTNCQHSITFQMTAVRSYNSTALTVQVKHCGERGRGSNPPPTHRHRHTHARAQFIRQVPCAPHCPMSVHEIRCGKHAGRACPQRWACMVPHVLPCGCGSGARWQKWPRVQQH